jgi:hypothetical protein
MKLPNIKVMKINVKNSKKSLSSLHGAYDTQLVCREKSGDVAPCLQLAHADGAVRAKATCLTSQPQHKRWATDKIHSRSSQPGAHCSV